ncbi:hypothetical protein MKQ68_14510 [Chitinophaga horti]|uniref:Lipoprotein n=1 Tax=Chitinophaga horti TaxID=2920382 RepID=A0ABY6IV98_9BACT|nr:hypothetical protein [Chitinophaga horti]UYQ91302.1 hypothetical protein MKQ68_14510 [Chitinophaga horti]
MKPSIKLAGVICLMAVMTAMFSSCASQKLGCPMKISKAPVTEKSKNC